MSNPFYRVIKDQPTNIMVLIRTAVLRSESPVFLLSFTQALADFIKHINPKVQKSKPQEPHMSGHLWDDLVKIQCGTARRSLTLEVSDYRRKFPTVLLQGLAQLV